MDNDIDMDIDFGDPNPPAEELQGYREPAAIDEVEQQQPSQIEQDEPVPNKVHIRGLDELTTKDIEDYATEHFSIHKPKVEWVDDTSANLVYEDASIAGQALQALTVTFNGSMPHELQLRSAKPFSAKPTTELQVRLATIKDRKVARAHERSRFYMMHPEHDPREQQRGDPEYRKRRYLRRRRSIENNKFDVSMYDDDARSVSSRSYASDGNTGDHSRQRRSRRDRDRSASPSRARGDYRRRDRSPRRPPPENKGKELFPAGTKNEIAANNAKKELFPQRKLGDGVLHRRNNSIDATHDFTTDVLSSTLNKTMNVPFVDGAADSHGGLRSDSIRERTGGFTIKGSAGFSIKGAAANSANTEAKVKELFPTKLSNKGKELFAGRMRRGADEFY